VAVYISQVSEEPTATDAAAPGAKGDSFVGSLEDAVLHNANQFHKWHTELEAACASETEEKYKQYAQLLQTHLASCDTLQDQVRVVCAVQGSIGAAAGPDCAPVNSSASSAVVCMVQ
jgi:hypothetical protein